MIRMKTTIKKEEMKITTINIPNSYLVFIDELVKMGVFPSRSGAFRYCLKVFLCKEANFQNNLYESELGVLA